MKRILVPTDFSSNAHAALDYAIELCNYWEETTIKVVHCIMPITGMDYPGIVPPVTELITARQNALKHFIHKDPAMGGTDIKTALNIETELIFGFPGEELTRMSYHYDYIVMGTSGSSDVLNQWLGNVASTIAKRSHCPVLLIPQHGGKVPPRHIAYAASEESVKGPLIQALVKFNQPFGANIQFVHVQNEQTFSTMEIEIFETLFKKDDPSIAFDMLEITGPDSGAALTNFIQDHQIDLLVLSHQQRNYWDSIFHHSLTKEMALSIQVPLLTLHI
jgi:nucleotide-binding universal stress UspA family protein